MIELENIEKMYDGLASTYKRIDEENADTDFAKFTALLKGKRVLDLGCGAGYDLLKFKNAGYDVYGIDISQNMLNECVNLGIQADRLIKADYSQLKNYFQSSYFDGVWAMASLVHI